VKHCIQEISLLKNYLLKKRGFQDKNAIIQKMIKFPHLPAHCTPLGTPDFEGNPAETNQDAVNYDLLPVLPTPSVSVSAVLKDLGNKKHLSSISYSPTPIHSSYRQSTTPFRPFIAFVLRGVTSCFMVIEKC